MPRAQIGHINMFVTELGHIEIEFGTVDPALLVAILDHKGSRGKKAPHENTYTYAGAIRHFHSLGHLVSEKVAEYIGDKSSSRSGYDEYGYGDGELRVPDARDEQVAEQSPDASQPDNGAGEE